MAEVLVRSMWNCALRNSWGRSSMSLHNVERTFVKSLSCPQFLPLQQPSWTVGRRVYSKGGRETAAIRGAGKSLWLEDDSPQPREQNNREDGGGGGDDNGRAAEYPRRPTRRFANEMEGEGEIKSYKKGPEWNVRERARQPSYIDEWGPVDDQETLRESSSRSENKASTSYASRNDSSRTSNRRSSPRTGWDGEWGEYLDRVERSKPAEERSVEDMGELRAGEGYRRQRRGFAGEQEAPMRSDADDGGSGYGRRPAQRPGGRDVLRPGISKYNDRGKRGGEQWSTGRRRDNSGNDEMAAGSQLDDGGPEREAWTSANEWGRGRQDNRRGRGRPWEDEEGGPLVKGGIELSGEVLYGVAPVQAAIRARRRELHTLYVQENLRPRKKGDKAAVERIKSEAQAAGALLREASKHTLNLLADNRPHQGLVLDAAPLGFSPLDELPPPPAEAALPAAAPVWVALDEVVDPQNFGAVLRSAYFLGAAGVLTCARNSSPLTAVVSKASAGAAEALEVFSCDSMPTTLGLAVQDGWRVLGASADPSAPLVTELPKGVPSVIVLGNEGVGLRTNVRRACSGFVRIAGKGTAFPLSSAFIDDEADNEADDEGAEGKAENISAESDDEGGHVELAAVARGGVVVDSLNVSVAAGILLHELLAPRPMAVVQKVEAISNDAESKQSDEVLAQLLSSQRR